MRTQLADRRARLERGDRPVGWKIGFGSPSAMEHLRISAPLVGFLTERCLLPSDELCPLSGWTRPRFEPEVAVYLSHDVPGGSTRSEVEAAIGGLGPAIELVDVHPPTEDVEAILAVNVFQRRLALGPARRGASLAGVTGRVLVDGQEVERTDDPQALPGELVGLVGLVADVLDASGERLRAGECVITGSVMPPMDIRSGTAVLFELGPIGTVEVAFA